MSIVLLKECENPVKLNGFVSKCLMIADEVHNVMYNQKKSICVFPCLLKHIQEILEIFSSSFPPKTILWTFLPLDKKLAKNIKKISDYSFDFPYITNMCPTGENIDTGMAFAKYISSDKKISEKQEFILHKCLYVLEEYQKNELACSMYAQISRSTLDFLRAASEHGVYKRGSELSHVKNEGDAHKEITGELCVIKIRKGEKIGKFVYVIGLREKSVEIGNHEDVDVTQTRYNFHTHPKEAYIKHSVQKAWPSLTDYLGFLKLGNSTIFHCVAALEGLYILSFSAYWGNHLKDVKKDFIKQHYKVNHRLPYSPEEYVKRMNKLYPISNVKYPIFEVQFFRWESAGSIFRIYYSRNGKTCISTEEDLNMHEKMHEKFNT